MSTLEIIAALLGLANVALVVRRSVWNYPFGIAMVSLYAVVFFEAQLYSDALLQIFFLVLNIYGWVSWLRVQKRDTVPVRWMGLRCNAVVIAVTAVLWFVWSSVMHRFTDAAAPYVDGAVACLSVAGQILMVRRFVENWIYWIVVNVVAIGLFWWRDLPVTSALYTVFLGLAIAGLIQWRRAAVVAAA
jgi:nicotinamide mononucleotide transporter